jgi:dGTPase
MPDYSRQFRDPFSDSLPPLALDRQRVVNSSAFRRLQHKTQAFVAPESDHFRTRLTHTLEVAHQARCMAFLLGLNTDLAEVVALAHDLGHPPFGHAGESALDACLQDQGGFEHNRHTLRVVEELEHPYPDFYGLNLTRAVRACLANHCTPFDDPEPHPLHDGTPPPPESKVVDLADRLTYALHDLLDGLYAGLITPEELSAVPLWHEAYNPPSDPSDDWRGTLRTTADRIQQRVYDELTALSSQDMPLPQLLSKSLDEQLNRLEDFLLERVYRSAAIAHADEHAGRILSVVFRMLLAQPEELPSRFRRRLERTPTWRVVADYLAGMTDRYCLDVYSRLADRASGEIA